MINKNLLKKIKRKKALHRRRMMIKYIKLAKEYKDYDWFNNWRVIKNIYFYKLQHLV